MSYTVDKYGGKHAASLGQSLDNIFTRMAWIDGINWWPSLGNLLIATANDWHKCFAC